MQLYNMNDIINFLLAGDKCMPEMNLRQAQFTYSLCGPFTKNKESLKKRKIQNIFTEMNYKKPFFNMMWLMEILWM